MRRPRGTLRAETRFLARIEADRAKGGALAAKADRRERPSMLTIGAQQEAAREETERGRAASRLTPRRSYYVFSSRQHRRPFRNERLQSGRWRTSRRRAPSLLKEKNAIKKKRSRRVPEGRGGEAEGRVGERVSLAHTVRPSVRHHTPRERDEQGEGRAH